MAKEDLKNLSTAKLESRKTFAAIVLGILVGVSALNIIVAVLAKRPELFGVAAAMFAVGYPMYAGRQKIEVELQTREDK